MQCVLHFDVQDTRQFRGEISARGTIDEHFGGGQQRAETREPDVSLRPQSMVVITGDFAQAYIALVIAVGAVALARGLFLWNPQDLPRFLWYLILAVPASCLKVTLPGVTGT